MAIGKNTFLLDFWYVVSFKTVFSAGLVNNQNWWIKINLNISSAAVKWIQAGLVHAKELMLPKREWFSVLAAPGIATTNYVNLPRAQMQESFNWSKSQR